MDGIFDHNIVKDIKTWPQQHLGHKFPMIVKTISNNERSGTGSKIPAHESIYRAIADRILFGDFYPGQAITLQGLADELSVSLTPVREAVRRLIAERALELHDNRRVSVPIISNTRYQEITSIRLFLEDKMAVNVAQTIDIKGIDEMSNYDDLLDASIMNGDVEQYMRNNFKFHFTLYNYSNCEVSLPIARALWTQIGPSHRIVCGRYGTGNLVDNHKEILAALRGKDMAALRFSLKQDIEQGNALAIGETTQPGKSNLVDRK